SPVRCAFFQRDSRLCSMYSLTSVLAKSAANLGSVESERISTMRVSLTDRTLTLAAAIPAACSRDGVAGWGRPRALRQAESLVGCSRGAGFWSSLGLATTR